MDRHPAKGYTGEGYREESQRSHSRLRGYNRHTPAIQFTGELMKLYPNSIVICTTRDQKDWWKSTQALVRNTNLWWLDLLLFPMPTLRWFGTWRDTIGDRYAFKTSIPRTSQLMIQVGICLWNRQE